MKNSKSFVQQQLHWADIGRGEIGERAVKPRAEPTAEGGREAAEREPTHFTTLFFFLPRANALARSLTRTVGTIQSGGRDERGREWSQLCKAGCDIHGKCL